MQGGVLRAMACRLHVSHLRAGDEPFRTFPSGSRVINPEMNINVWRVRLISLYEQANWGGYTKMILKRVRGGVRSMRRFPAGTLASSATTCDACGSSGT